MTSPFHSLVEFQALVQSSITPDQTALKEAQDRNAMLTKPPHALGRLEDLAIWYASWRSNAQPMIKKPQVVVFAGNHGICAQGISAFPAEVTTQMVANFAANGAAINQLCQVAGASLDVIELSLDQPTADFTAGPAMCESEAVAALQAGWNAVDPSADLFVAGEMGIGNTTSAAAITYALLGGAPSDWAGRGTGVDDAGLARKCDVLERGIKANPSAKGNPLAALSALGGREIAAIAGAYAAARAHHIPVLLDGFIASSAALCLHQINPNALDHMVAAHQSNEQAHDNMLKAMNKKPLLDLQLRLGEGSGAALAINILHAALACHSGMATFEQAGVATK